MVLVAKLCRSHKVIMMVFYFLCKSLHNIAVLELFPPQMFGSIYLCSHLGREFSLWESLNYWFNSFISYRSIKIFFFFLNQIEWFFFKFFHLIYIFYFIGINFLKTFSYFYFLWYGPLSFQSDTSNLCFFPFS